MSNNSDAASAHSASTTANAISNHQQNSWQSPTILGFNEPPNSKIPPSLSAPLSLSAPGSPSFVGRVFPSHTESCSASQSFSARLTKPCGIRFFQASQYRVLPSLTTLGSKQASQRQAPLHSISPTKQPLNCAEAIVL